MATLKTPTRKAAAFGALVLLLVGKQLNEATAWTALECAPARQNEPVLSDAIHFGTGLDSAAVSWRYIYDLPLVAPTDIRIVSDSVICATAQTAYATIAQRWMPSYEVRPVIVVQLGTLYLVDDQSPRTGPNAYWEVMAFDRSWQRQWSYGGGA